MASLPHNTNYQSQKHNSNNHPHNHYTMNATNQPHHPIHHSPSRPSSYSPRYSSHISAPTPPHNNSRSSFGLGPSALGSDSPPVPKRRERPRTYSTSQRICTTRVVQPEVNVFKLSQQLFTATSSPSSSYSGSINSQTATPLTSQKFTVPDALPPVSPSTPQPPHSTELLPYTSFPLCTSSPTRTITPTSPLKVAFSSTKSHRYNPTAETATFASYFNQLSPNTKQQYIKQLEGDELKENQRQQQNCARSSINMDQRIDDREHNSDSLFSNGSQMQLVTPNLAPGSQRPPPMQQLRQNTSPRQQHQQQQHPVNNSNNGNRSPNSGRSMTSMGAMSPPKQNNASVIPIHVRYVPKDLWVQVDLPKNIPVHKARDLILAKCRLTCMPPQTLSTVISDPQISLPTLPEPIPVPAIPVRAETGGSSCDSRSSPPSSVSFESSNMLAPSHCLDGRSTPASSLRSFQPSRSSGMDDGESFNDQESTDDDEAELRAEALMADIMFPQSPPLRTPSKSSTYSNTENHEYHRTRSPSSAIESTQRQQQHQSYPSSGSTSSASSEGRTGNDQQQGAALNQQQLKKLISYSSLHKDEAYYSGSGSAGDRGSRDSLGCSSRLNHIPGWNTYKNRHNSSNAKQMVREVLDHGGKLEDWLGDEDSTNWETSNEECSAWKACFGLFWHAAGHWLDDSRLVSSYHFQPHCLLELQLRNNYIQLPATGTGLNYYDHYAEGVLYKMSKKNRQVSKLTNGVKDCSGVWKSRWVVLQGHKLFIYHKQKDTTKKSIELLPPLSVTTTTVPHNPHHSFRSPSSAMPISATMITLTLSQDPNAPKVCFRATSESELNHWVRIFNSLNFAPLCGVPPPLFPNSLMNSPIIKPSHIPPPLPPLPLDLPPISMNVPPPRPIKKRERHQSQTAAIGGTNDPRYPTERKRCHTTQGVQAGSPQPRLPSINPVLISNAAAALSNLNQSSDMGNGSDNCGSNGDNSACKRSRSVSTRTSGQISIVGRDRLRTMSQASAATLVDSLLNGRDLPQLQHHPLTRNTSSSSGHQSQYQYQSLGLQYDGDGSLNQRQRTMTEPSDSQRIRVRSMSSQRSSQQTLLREYIRSRDIGVIDTLSDIADIPDTPSADSNDLKMPTEFECQELLNSSNKRSLASPLYSGYIWLYVPNTHQPSTPPSSKNGQNSSFSSVSMSKSSSGSSLTPPSATSGSKANICISKASGRYVKCFVVINSLGQFQWIEVNNENGKNSEMDSDDLKEQVVNSSYGIQLNPKLAATLANPDKNTASILVNRTSVNEKAMLSGPARGSVQVSMAHKLRLYFFCIKISISSMSEVLVEMVDTPETEEKLLLSRNSSFNRSGYATPTQHSPPPSLNKKSPLRINNRLSAPLAHQRGSIMLGMTTVPVRSSSFQRKKNRNRNSTQSSSSLKNNGNALWPSMSHLHERTNSSPLQQAPAIQIPDRARMIPKTFPVLPLPKTTVAPSEVELAASGSLEEPGPISKRLLTKTQSLFMENRARSSAPPGSIQSRTAIDYRGSLQSDARSSSTAAAVISRHESLMHVLGRATGTMYPSDGEVTSVALTGTNGTSEEQSETGQGSKSQVLLLAQDLQKALERCQDLPERGSPKALEQESKPTLFEITAKKRASIQQLQDSANVEAARLKLIGGKLESLTETNDGEVVSVENEVQKSERAKEKEQEKELRQAVAKILMQCPFLEKSETCVDIDGRRFVTLKGYTETEEAWRMLQSSLDQVLDGPIKDQRSALPPEDTLIPSYHAPRLPDFRLSEKAQNFLRAKDRAAAAAAAALKNNGQTSMTIDTAITMAATTAATTIGNEVSTSPANSPMAMARACLSRANTTTSSNASTIVAGTCSMGIRSRRSATLAVFNRHSIPLAHGVGYGPRKSFMESNENNKNAEHSSLPGCIPAAMSMRRNLVDTSRGTRFRTESESGPGHPSSAMAATAAVLKRPIKNEYRRSVSGNMFMKHHSSGYQLQKQTGHNGGGGAVAHLKATGASISRWMHLSGHSSSGSLHSNLSSTAVC
ncbi:hypothetical protein BGX27_009252, partial [Mortierella sp. AM989]